MTARRRLPENTLTALLSSAATPPAPARATKASRTPTPSPAAEAPRVAAPRRVKATFNLDPALLGECRAAVVTLAGAPLRLTLSALVERALRAELDRLKRAHHQGRPFPAHDAPLVGGRPVKAP